jgi:hypothetical protein
MTYYTVREPTPSTFLVAKFSDSDAPIETYTIKRHQGLLVCSCPSVNRLRRGQLCKHGQLVNRWLADGAPVRSYTITGDWRAPRIETYADLSTLLGE